MLLEKIIVTMALLFLFKQTIIPVMEIFLTAIWQDLIAAAKEYLNIGQMQPAFTERRISELSVDCPYRRRFAEHDEVYNLRI